MNRSNKLIKHCIIHHDGVSLKDYQANLSVIGHGINLQEHAVFNVNVYINKFCILTNKAYSRNSTEYDK